MRVREKNGKGQLRNVWGVDIEAEEPTNPEVIIDNDGDKLSEVFNHPIMKSAVDRGVGIYFCGGSKVREDCGKKGSEYLKSKDIKMTAKMMSKGFVEGIETTLENWKPRERYTMEVV